MADITITLQAASDSIMTLNNRPSELGTAAELADDDARKVYGLPNMWVSSVTNILKWETGGYARWDEVGGDALGVCRPGETLSAYQVNGLSVNGDVTTYTKRPPSTTSFQLRCEQISHDFNDQVSVSPLPAADVRNGQFADAGTPGQLNTLVLALGVRTESIKLSGTMVDRGKVSATNPRRQILLNLARMQHLKIARGTGGKDGWGGPFAGPMNPASYPCLTLFDALATPGFSMGREPSGDSRQYRGIIKDLSFRMEGGRPDIWEWDMTFQAINNEHTPASIDQKQWVGHVNRMRLMEDNDGGGDELDGSDPSEGGYIELRLDRDLDRKVVGLSKSIVVEMDHADRLYIEGSTSTPTLNGMWWVRGINLSNRTLIIGGIAGMSYGERTITDHANNLGQENNLFWRQGGFAAATGATVVWGHNLGS